MLGYTVETSLTTSDVKVIHHFVKNLDLPLDQPGKWLIIALDIRKMFSINLDQFESIMLNREIQRLGQLLVSSRNSKNPKKIVIDVIYSNPLKPDETSLQSRVMTHYYALDPDAKFFSADVERAITTFDDANIDIHTNPLFQPQPGDNPGDTASEYIDNLLRQGETSKPDGSQPDEPSPEQLAGGVAPQPPTGGTGQSGDAATGGPEGLPTTGTGTGGQTNGELGGAAPGVQGGSAPLYNINLPPPGMTQIPALLMSRRKIHYENLLGFY